MAGDVGSTRPRIDKLGIKPGMRVLLIGADEPNFLDELRERGADLVTGHVDDVDAVFLRIDAAAELTAIARCKPALAKTGALWVLRPRGSPDLSEAAVLRAGLDAGLVDVKVVRFSETHSAAKFVYRLRDR